MSWKASLASICLLGLLAVPGAGDQTDERLNGLFETLRRTADPAEANRAERQIWLIWIESGREEVDELMNAGSRAMSSGRLTEAIATFGRITELAPEFAEGWNKRATAFYLADELEASVFDIRRTLALEPRHFGAISGMGLILLERGDEEGALKAFQHVLEIHPHARGAQAHVEILLERLGRSRI